MATKTTTVALPQERPAVPLKDRKVQGAVRELRALADQERAIKERRGELERMVKDALGAAEIGTVGGKPVVSYVESIRTSVSATMIKKKYPEIASECSVLTAVRTFKILDES